MPAKNIECQLAQGQIGRYLAGTDISDEAVRQLEQHIVECEDCTNFVDRKRQSLHEVAGLRHAVVEMPAPKAAAIAETEPVSLPKQAATQALIQAIRDRANPLSGQTVLETVRESGPPRKRYWKTLAYSLALGAVLLVMSHLAANPTSMFGDRVGPSPVKEILEPLTAKAIASTAEPVSDGDPFTPEKPIDKPAAQPNNSVADTPKNTITVLESSTIATSSKKVTPPTTPSSSTPTQPNIDVTSKRPGRTVRTPRRSRPAPRGGNSIRVYDAQGNPLQ
jgi:hypothetical protein